MTTEKIDQKQMVPPTESLQTAGMVFMVEPNSFGFNEETAATNTFQSQIDTSRPIAEIALEEFGHVVNELEKAGVKVVSIPSREDIITPDAVFPNNWFSMHQKDGKRILVLYPMLAPNRRAERRPEELLSHLKNNGVTIDQTIDLTYFEKEDKALEGTGSLIIDRDNNIAYAVLSPRTNIEPLNELCKQLNLSSVIFESQPIEEVNIYHTNVIMSVGKKFAVISPDIIKHKEQEQLLLDSLTRTGKDIINITKDQVLNMCGNIIELKDAMGNPQILMSKRAFDNFESHQVKKLKSYGNLVVVNMPTIETVGGGSARCLVCEIF